MMTTKVTTTSALLLAVLLTGATVCEGTTPTSLLRRQLADGSHGDTSSCGGVTCMSGSTCVAGPADPGDHPVAFGTDDESAEYHCECPEEWHGKDCSIAVDNCGNNVHGNPHYCYNGGSCIYVGNSIAAAFCDCEDAKDANDKKYFGTYCEHHEATPAPTPAPTEPDNILCGSDIECKNGSTCTAGPADIGDHPVSFGADDQDAEFHCKCLEGWHGKDCSVPVNKCGKNVNGNIHYCYNGGSCIYIGNAIAAAFCDCMDAYGAQDKKFFGTYCEHSDDTVASDSEVTSVPSGEETTDAPSGEDETDAPSEQEPTDAPSEQEPTDAPSAGAEDDEPTSGGNNNVEMNDGNLTNGDRSGSGSKKVIISSLVAFVLAFILMVTVLVMTRRQERKDATAARPAEGIPEMTVEKDTEIFNFVSSSLHPAKPTTKTTDAEIL